MSTSKTKIETSNTYTKQSTGSPSVYQLNLKDAGTKDLQKKDFGGPSKRMPKNKTIMLLGATGSGKSTLINGMINYILGVNWTDKRRFKLIEEQTKKTAEVTAYQIHYQNNFQVPYSLTIIDTPGFGDTKGVKQDKMITDKIRQFFSEQDGILGLDAVCFVVQSALARFSSIATQKYIFDAILSIFGKDIADNITIMITFADGQRPPVLDAINTADIPCVKKPDGSILHFKFNNSALFAQLNNQDDDIEDNFTEMFWKMGKASMKRFFTHLEIMETKSLQITKDVLFERKQLEATVNGVQPLIQTGLAKLEEIRTIRAALEQNQNIIKDNENFEYELDVIKYNKVDNPRGTFVTKCLGCNYTCHYPCPYSDTKDLLKCSTMKDGVCTVCPGKCPWNIHHNMPYRIETITVKEKRTYANLKEKYEKALGQKMSTEKIMEQLEKEYEDVQGKVLQMSDDLTKSLTRLKQITLRPDPLTTPDYIELLIESEKQLGKEGYMKRIGELEEIRTRAVILQKVEKGEPLIEDEKVWKPKKTTGIGELEEIRTQALILQKVEKGEPLTEDEKVWKPKKTTDIHHQSKMSPSKIKIERNVNYTKLSSGSPSVYRLNLKDIGTKEMQKKDFGGPCKRMQKNKTIMLLGATGPGKSTLINGMINYILGVNWTDEWRFKLIDEQTNKTQAESQMSEVTAYQIHYQNNFQVPYSLTIIDTPGFGDTKGIEQDKKITDKIRQFFSEQDGILGLDAVCFVVQSALARLTPTQKYIFDAILSIFGKDIAENITIMITFADGQRPPVLDAINAADIPCVKKPDGSILHFKFNNSALFAQLNNQDDDVEDNFDEMFWKMGKVNMKRFFTHLEIMETKSLQLTKEVLSERKQLEATVNGVQPLIQIGLAKLEEIRMTSTALEQNQNIIKEHANFEYELDVIKYNKVDNPRGTFVTNCRGCNFTCHYPCPYSDDRDKKYCAAMKDGVCTVCPGKCPWNVHYNTPYRIETKTVKEKRTYANLKEKYETALGEKIFIEKILEQLEMEYEDVQEKVLQMSDDLTKSLTRLKQIALRPDPLTTPDYIDLLIESEKQSGKEGYMKCIAELEELKSRVLILQKVEKGEPLTADENPWRRKSQKAKLKIQGLFNNALEWF